MYQSLIKNALSGAILVGAEKFIGRDGGKLVSVASGKKFLAQSVSSYMLEPIGNYVLPVLPLSISGISNYYLDPIIVGGIYSVITWIIKGIDGKNMLKRFIYSVGSEFLSNYAVKLLPCSVVGDGAPCFDYSVPQKPYRQGVQGK